MQSICFFSSYYHGTQIPAYVKIYLENLKKYFSEIVFLTNEKVFSNSDHEYLNNNNILLRIYVNEGYDFGMWYKAFQEFPVLTYDRIGLINDSCILFKRPDYFFEWLDKNAFDYCGMTDSNSIAYHIQSYFLIINKNAIRHVRNYFDEHKIVSDISSVITQYEVGLCTCLLEKKLKLGACYSFANYNGEHSPMLYFADKLIKDGIPLIKKKIIFSSFRKNEYLSLMRMNFIIDPRYYIKVIEEANTGKLLIDFNLISEEYYTKEFLKNIRKFKIKSFLFQIARKFKFLKN